MPKEALLKMKIKTYENTLGRAYPALLNKDKGK
jgi:hypothetical protein